MKLSDHLHMPPVGTLMTPFPHTIAAETPVSEVEARMKSEDFRHLPVVEEGSIVGIVSIRDLNRATSQTDARQVMTPAPYIVDTSAPLAEVLREMVTRKIGTTLVSKRGKLVGILTLTDICDALADVLEDRYGPESAA